MFTKLISEVINSMIYGLPSVQCENHGKFSFMLTCVVIHRR